MDFWRNENDLKFWIVNQKTPEAATQKIIGIIGQGRENENEVLMTCKNIIDKNDDSSASVLFRALAKYNLTTIKEGRNMSDKIKKEAQAVMRQDSLYGNMPTRICPKLPVSSAGKGLISTYNCRHYCLDSVVFDDDPSRVHCAEALWRRHVMDKFSREFKDKDGKWVGGYINERFQVIQDDGGNPMQLAHGERSRKPRAHQYSIERRLSEARGDKTYDITASIKNDGIVRLASSNSGNKEVKVDKTYSVFDDVIEMKTAGIKDDEILTKVSDHYNIDISDVAKVMRMAKSLVEIHDGDTYVFEAIEKEEKKNFKIASNNFQNGQILVSTEDGVPILVNGRTDRLPSNTEVVINNSDTSNPFFVSKNNGMKFTLPQEVRADDVFTIPEITANEVGLNDSSPQVVKDTSSTTKNMNNPTPTEEPIEATTENFNVQDNTQK